MTSSVLQRSESEQLARPKTVALFISDLHLQVDMPATTAVFLDFLKQYAIHTRQLYLLGDIFEYWAGDDDLDSPFPQKITQALREVSEAGVELFWMAGNRDFLVAHDFASVTKSTLLSDPYIFEYAQRRYLLTHGDLLCTDDSAYQQFRTQVRNPNWQATFLAQPLMQRKAIIAAMRQQSQRHQQQQIRHSGDIMDTNHDAVLRLFANHQADVIIHGHTHRPSLHTYGKQARYVLSDWDRDCATALRGDWLALMEDGHLQRFDACGLAIAENKSIS